MPFTPSTSSAPRHLNIKPADTQLIPLPGFALIIGILWMIGSGFQVIIGISTAATFLQTHALLAFAGILGVAWETLQFVAGYRLVKGHEMGRRMIRFVLGLRLVSGLAIIPAFLYSAGRFPTNGQFWMMATLMLGLMAAFYAFLYSCFRHLGSDEVRNACASRIGR